MAPSSSKRARRKAARSRSHGAPRSSRDRMTALGLGWWGVDAPEGVQTAIGNRRLEQPGAPGVELGARRVGQVVEDQRGQPLVVACECLHELGVDRAPGGGGECMRDGARVGHAGILDDLAGPGQGFLARRVRGSPQHGPRQLTSKERPDAWDERLGQRAQDVRAASDHRCGDIRSLQGLHHHSGERGAGAGQLGQGGALLKVAAQGGGRTGIIEAQERLEGQLARALLICAEERGDGVRRPLCGVEACRGQGQRCARADLGRGVGQQGHEAGMRLLLPMDQPLRRASFRRVEAFERQERASPSWTGLFESASNARQLVTSVQQCPPDGFGVSTRRAQAGPSRSRTSTSNREREGRGNMRREGFMGTCFQPCLGRRGTREGLPGLSARRPPPASPGPRPARTGPWAARPDCSGRCAGPAVR